MTMARRGRPPKSGRTFVFNIKLRLRETEDDDLIRFLESVPPGQRAAAIKTALRTGGLLTHGTGEDDDADDEDLGLDMDDFFFDEV